MVGVGVLGRAVAGRYSLDPSVLPDHPSLDVPPMPVKRPYSPGVQGDIFG